MHESWVLSLASRLREDGVDVILDKWDLKPGHDAISFMESMVTDPTVAKVIIICDRVYAQKADARSGGVGTESQIISPEIYAGSKQDKFAAILTEVDEYGEAYLPAYYRGRIYFDFRSGEVFEEAYEQLLRWLADRPQHIKPKLGTLPEALLGAQPTATGTQSRAKRAEEAIKQSTANAAAFVREYGDALLPELRNLTPELASGEDADDKVLASVEAGRPYARQLIEVITVAARYSTDPRVWDAVLALVERVGRLMWRDPELQSWHTTQFDAFKVIAHDVFVSTLAVALDEERFDLAAVMLARSWLVRDAEGVSRQSTSDFTVFNQHVKSLDARNQRLRLRRISLHADIVHEAHRIGSTPSFESVMQADFVIFLRSVGRSTDARWYPFTLTYATDRFSPFPIFARSESEAYFARLTPVLAVPDLAEFRRSLAEFQSSERARQMFDYHGLAANQLANADFLGSRA